MTTERTHQNPATMRAFAVDQFGDPGSLRNLPTPEIGAEEILVRVHAAGVNPIDWKIRDSGPKRMLSSLGIFSMCHPTALIPLLR